MTRSFLLSASLLATLPLALASCAGGGCGCGPKTEIDRETGGPRVVNFVTAAPAPIAADARR